MLHAVVGSVCGESLVPTVEKSVECGTRSDLTLNQGQEVTGLVCSYRFDSARYSNNTRLYFVAQRKTEKLL